MPLPGKGCNHLNPMNENVKAGSINICFTHRVKMAPTDSRKHKNPKIILKTTSPELSICLNRNLSSMIFGNII